jgi:large subunit ribosomal protein L13
MIIDASNLILGRMASKAAKKALLGEKVEIVNCEKAVMTGNYEDIMEKEKAKADRGSVYKGPYQPRMPDRYVRRVIRGMLPRKNERGRLAFKRVMCYIGDPDKLKSAKIETFTEANVSKVPNLRYVTVMDICKYMGEKV